MVSVLVPCHESWASFWWWTYEHWPKPRTKGFCRPLDVEIAVLFDFLYNFYSLVFERIWQNNHFLGDSLLSHSFSTCTTCSWLGFSGVLELLEWLWKNFQTDRRQHHPSGDVDVLCLIVTWHGSQTYVHFSHGKGQHFSYVSGLLQTDRIAATFVKELRNKTMH